MPKETPILFTGEMVRAILDGRKTQTRRMIKSPSRKHDHFTLVDYGDGLWPYLSDDGESSITDDGNETAIECPCGQPGDRLFSTDENRMLSIGCVIWGVSEMDKWPSMIPNSYTGSGQLFPKQISGTCPTAKGCH